MSLVYLITGLPLLRRGEAAPLTRAELVRRCRDILQGRHRAEFERLLQVEAVEETVRLTLRGELAELGEQELAASVLLDREDGVAREHLPDWLLRPAPQHQLLRRHYHELTRAAQTEFLRRWANFRVDVGEVLTALLCRAEGMGREAFLVQMEGSFDASAPVIMRHWDEPDLGLGGRFAWLPKVAAAVELDDLLEMSRALDGVLWAKLEELSTEPLFSVETLLAYYLKLRIVEREASWDAARGQQVLDRILALSSQATAQGGETAAPPSAAVGMA